jgi:hypothetical protein|tara:strand:- start:616 stop:786 length:171 start_codon:yes stop_codon:yes gene_type:complete
MANRYFNKQVAESRKPLAGGGSSKPKVRKISKGVRDRNTQSAEVIRLIKLAKKKRK